MCGLNGDWSQMRIEIYWAPWHGAEPPVSELRDIIRKVVLDTLARARPPTWPQHRWTGFRESVRGVLLFMHCHNLLLNTYKRFMRAVHQRACPVGQQSAEDDVSYDLAYHDGVAHEDGLAKAVQQSSGAETGSVPASAESHAAKNSKDRELALSFLESNPLPVLTMMAIVLECMDWLLQAYFHRASAFWEQTQR
eukprot:4371444-Amphidinium_carterae.1